MRSLLAIFLLLSSPANADAITRYYFRIHIFFDSGLKIRESKSTFKDMKTCDKAGERDVKRYPEKMMAEFICEPIHIIINNGGRYT